MSSPDGPVSPAAGSAAPARLRRVLVVDDNRDIAQTLGCVLQIAGHEVFEASNGVQALLLADRVQPQLALLDIGLPDISGWDLCRALRARDYGASMTIFAITAWGGERDHAESRAAGFDAHFVKPVNVWSLLERLSGDTSVS
jgi:DNA-binding response OmpR family regulator